MTHLSTPRLLNPKHFFFTILFTLVSAILISGCGLKSKEPSYSKEEAELKFIQICKQEYNWDVHTKLIGNTFWIYLPYEGDIFQFKANRFGQTSKCAVGYLKGNFVEKTFSFEYQIMPILKTEGDKGYTYSLTEKIGEDFQNLLNVIYRVYFNAERQPEFYTIVMADIVNGVEVIYTIYGLDLKKVYNQAIPGEEYYKRVLQDIKGDLAIIRDKTGRHLSYQEVELGQFLSKQIVQRIHIKFIGAEGKLCGIPDEEILRIISYCLRTYEFEDYLTVTLKNLSTGTEITEFRSFLEEIKEL